MSLDDRRALRSPDWVSVHEAATLMGVSPATLRRWSDAGTILAFTTPGGHRRFSRSAIAGLLPQAAGELDRRQLDRLDEGLVRAVRRCWRRTVRAADLAGAIGPADEATLTAHGRRIIDGFVAALEIGDGDGRGSMRAARRSAWACGGIAARRGISLRQTMDVALDLQATVVHEVAAAARRLDLDAPTTASWLEAAARALQGLLSEAMRGHTQASVMRDDPKPRACRTAVGRR